MATSRELITQIRLQTASVESLGPFLNPYHGPNGSNFGHDSMGAAAAARDLGQPIVDASFLGGGGVSNGRSNTDLIQLGSVRSARSTRGSCALPVGNTFSTTRM